MKLSMRWLSDYYNVKSDISDYIDDMTMSGSKVEGYKKEDGEISKVVVGKVLSVTPHSNADSLIICSVDIGEDLPVQIVTGADNVVAGAIVPVALHKSTLPGGVKITKGKLRGELSEGMLCSLNELNLTQADFPYANPDGIFLLEEDCKVGDSIAQAIGLDDTIVEFEITSNRPDCLSVIGLARESAATYGEKFTPRKPSVKAGGKDVNSILKVEVENKELCRRYMAGAVENVKIAPSPRWMRERLRASGVRPINNIVDITNYVMLEHGQPMHAFDLRHVEGEHIIIRSAKQGEALVTLDGEEHKLSGEMLVIADNKAPTAVAGVMGGQYSGVYDDTKTVIFESANFVGSSVRRTAKKLGIRTESSGRFEKGLDSRVCEDALLRALELCELLEVGTVAKGVIDRDNHDYTPNIILFEPDWTNKFVGIELGEKAMIEILNNLDFKVENGNIIVPSFRSGDVANKYDIAEEITRIYGYNKIPTTSLRGESKGIVTREQHFRKAVNSAMVASGFYEIITYSFYSPNNYDKILLPEDSPLRDSVTIRNPLGEDTSALRTTALPSMLMTLAYNYNNRNQAGALFEIASRYIKIEGKDLPEEPKTIMIGQYGGKSDFYTLKGGVETLLNSLKITGTKWEPLRDNPSYHPGRTAAVTLNGENLGIVGEVNPIVCENFGISGHVYVAELDYDLLYANFNSEPQFRPLPKFPASTRDLALICDKSVLVGEIREVMEKTIGSLLEKLELFDVYEGSQIEENKKSVAYALTLRANDRTLTDKESDEIIDKTLKALEKIDVELRS